MRSDIEAKIKEVVDCHKEIVAVYLYGSFAKGTEIIESDIDVALLLREHFVLSTLYPFRIAGEIENTLKRKVDVRILNDASPSFINQVFKYGKLLYSRDEKSRVKFELRAMRAYLDIKPLHIEYNRVRRMRVNAE